MKREAIVFGLWPALWGVAGCGEVRDGDAFDNPSGVAQESGGGGTAAGNAVDGGTSASNADTTASDPEDGDGESGAVFDVGTRQDLPGTACGPDERCGCDAVDLLMIVDNSGSMTMHRAAIIDAFPTFVGEMFSALPTGTDLHVGLTRATGFFDPGNGGAWAGPECEGNIDGTFFPPDQGDNGTNGQQGRLFEHAGQRYFAVDTSDDPGPLESWFDGALTGVIDGAAPHSNTETVVAGAAYPFHPANAAYNDGFMRTNAVLVLFLLSDSPDLTPAEIPTSQFIDMVRDAKAECGGDPCIVTSGAIAGACYDNPDNINTRLTDFMNAFGGPPASWVDLGFVTPDFTGVLGGALADVVASTCEDIPPEG